MSTALDLDEDLVLGKTIRFFRWVNQQMEKCHARGVTKKWLDRYLRCDGFGTALENVGWLVEDEEGISIPHFDRWHSKSAKKRLKQNERQRRRRSQKCHAQNVTSSSVTVMSSSSSLEEEKRNGSKRFSPPSLEEVESYCASIESKIDPQEFLDYYGSQSWRKANGQRVSDWKACVRTFTRKDRQRNQQREIEF